MRLSSELLFSSLELFTVGNESNSLSLSAKFWEVLLTSMQKVAESVLLSSLCLLSPDCLAREMFPVSIPQHGNTEAV